MEAQSHAASGAGAERSGKRPAWIAGLVPLVVLGALIGLFVALGAPGLDRPGVPQEEIAVERTVLRPGEIELHVRNDGADRVAIEQAIVNDGFTEFTQTNESIGRLGASTIQIQFPWIEGEAYEVLLVTSTGGTIDSAIDVAVESPDADLGFYGLMALIGLYVGVIPVAIGMLWLPWVRRIDPRWVQFLMALTVGLLAFLGIDAILEGIEFAGEGAAVFGGPVLVYVGAIVAYLALAGVDGWLRRREHHARDDAAVAPAPARASGLKLALLIAIGIGLHNLGEGLAIGSAYAIGSLALGAALIVGFAIHNTTEGLAIVAPVAGPSGAGGGSSSEDPSPERPRLSRLALLGLIAGAPAILGAFIGASAYNTSLAAFLFGLGAGAIAQVIVQILPALRDRAGRVLHPLAVGGLLAGIALMYATSLLITA
ncbi:MAG: hypothetical protein WD649_00560 [Thermoleophilaceae bacterium]